MCSQSLSTALCSLHFLQHSFQLRFLLHISWSSQNQALLWAFNMFLELSEISKGKVHLKFKVSLETLWIEALHGFESTTLIFVFEISLDFQRRAEGCSERALCCPTTTRTGKRQRCHGVPRRPSRPSSANLDGRRTNCIHACIHAGGHADMPTRRYMHRRTDNTHTDTHTHIYIQTDVHTHPHTL